MDDQTEGRVMGCQTEGRQDAHSEVGSTEGWSDRVERQSDGGEIRDLRLRAVLKTDDYMEGEVVLEP